MHASTAVNSVMAKTAIMYLQDLSEPHHFRVSLKHRVSLVPTDVDCADFSVKHDRILEEAEGRGRARDVVVGLVEYACNAARDAPQNNRSICFVRLPVDIMANEIFQTYLERTVDDKSMGRARICLELPQMPVSNSFSFKSLVQPVGRGFLMSLGNFGTGISSFALLRDLPVSFVQIAPSFVSGILTDPISREMVRSLNEIAHLKGVRSIAAGAESHEHLSMLRALGVDYVEGPAIQTP